MFWCSLFSNNVMVWLKSLAFCRRYAAGHQATPCTLGAPMAIPENIVWFFCLFYRQCCMIWGNASLENCMAIFWETTSLQLDQLAKEYELLATKSMSLIIDDTTWSYMLAAFLHVVKVKKFKLLQSPMMIASESRAAAHLLVPSTRRPAHRYLCLIVAIRYNRSFLNQQWCRGRSWRRKFLVCWMIE